MKMVRNNVIIKTGCFGFMNLGRLIFGCDLTTEKPTKKSETITIPFAVHPMIKKHH